MKEPSFYVGGHGKDYEAPSRLGYTSVEVLPHLKGHLWDHFALAYVHAARPSKIRVVAEGTLMTADSWHWRVTVHVDKTNRITKVEQEVAVGLPVNIDNGFHLNQEFTKTPE
jgi:hypothetical protein